jgi:hypothetical protein
VRWKVVHHHDVAAPERWNQALLHVGEEHFSIHGTVDHHGRRHFIVTQGGHEGTRLPCPKWHLADQSDAPRGSAAEAQQVGTDGGLVDQYQPGGIKQALLPNPTSARAGDVRALPFSGLQRFSLKVMSCRSRKRQSELRLVRIRRLRSTATVSTKVRSGCSAITAKICVANLSSGETLPPRGFAMALPVSCQRCTHFIAELALTSYSSAASRRDAPISTASITRSRSSLEQAFAIPHPRKEESMCKDSLTYVPLGIPPIQIGREPL